MFTQCLCPRVSPEMRERGTAVLGRVVAHLQVLGTGGSLGSVVIGQG